MAEFEPLKPSNTGWLVADVLLAATAYGWSRKAVDPALLDRLLDHVETVLIEGKSYRGQAHTEA